MPDPEIDAPTLRHLTEYVRFLAPPAPAPPPAGAARDTLAQGAALFGQIGCTSCHRQELRTGSSAAATLARQTFRPYSDLLLHDMGAELADVCGRTPPPANFARLPSGAFGTATAFCTTAEQRMCRRRSRRTAGKRRAPGTPSTPCRTMPGAPSSAF